ncbi:MAG: hydrogenase maturation nickel metallochaperone HypA [Arcanobacterium sp.]|nr:hydrogenase maturation nickel metallochaperone HypA [Arcanobacterium sp.]MDY5588789.1 hydrogenase maturation nickel metallochaperone HypA [Arcanobacterium sp.]
MHELSLCCSIYKIAQRAAQGRQVREIGLDIGELRQVVPQTLIYCWETTTRRTTLSGAQLAVTYIPGVLACSDCGHRTELHDELIYRCEQCDSIAVTVESGNEFTLTYIDVG